MRETNLNIIYSNELIMETLKEVFMSEAQKNMPRVNGQSDEIIGQEFRAYCKAVEIIEDTFIHLKGLHTNTSGGSSVKFK